MFLKEINWPHWNCKHVKHKVITPDFIAKQTDKYLHQFSWLNDNDTGELPRE
jgi:hypothetical protein